MRDNIKITIIGLLAMAIFGIGIIFSIKKLSESKKYHRDKIESNFRYLDDPTNE